MPLDLTDYNYNENIGFNSLYTKITEEILKNEETDEKQTKDIEENFAKDAERDEKITANAELDEAQAEQLTALDEKVSSIDGKIEEVSEKTDSLVEVTEALASADEVLDGKISALTDSVDTLKGNIETVTSDEAALEEKVDSIKIEKVDTQKYALYVGDAVKGEIDFPTDSYLADIKVEGDDLIFIYELSGETKEVRIDLRKYIDEFNFNDGLTFDPLTRGVSILLDNCDDFVEVSESGLKISGIKDALNAKVDWVVSEGDRKHVVLKNHDSILGTATDGSTYNLAMVSKWDVADFGSNKLHLNLNSKDDVTVNDSEKIALQSWVKGQGYLTEHQDLSDYAKKTDVPSLDGYATEAWVEGKNYLTEHQSLADYATQSWVEGKNYLTEHQDLSEYAKKAEIPSLDGYATEAWVEGKGYLTEHQSLADYATKEEVGVAKAEAISEAKYDDASIKALVSQLNTRIEMLESIQPSLVVASDASAIQAITDPQNTNLVVSSQDALESMSAQKVYKSIAIVGADTEKSIFLTSTGKIAIDGLTVNGEKDGGNGKINYATKELEIKNVEITAGTTSYNVFEGSQVTAHTDYAIVNLDASNVNVDDVDLTHNVINVYTPNNNAVINLKDSSFNLNAAKSNIMRISNYLNSENVTINFENVNWTYENMPYSEDDKAYAGVLLFQPASTDVALSGDTSKIATWTVNVKNCYYNGVKVTANNFGEISQFCYGYNIGGTKTVSNLAEIMNVNFE